MSLIVAWFRMLLKAQNMRFLHWNGKVVRMTVLVVTRDVNVPSDDWRPEQSLWRPFGLEQCTSMEMLRTFLSSLEPLPPTPRWRDRTVVRSWNSPCRQTRPSHRSSCWLWHNRDRREGLRTKRNKVRSLQWSHMGVMASKITDNSECFSTHSNHVTRTMSSVYEDCWWPVAYLAPGHLQPSTVKLTKAVSSWYIRCVCGGKYLQNRALPPVGQGSFLSIPSFHKVESQRRPRTFIRAFHKDPTVCPCVIRLDDVRGRPAAPASDDEHDLMRHARSWERMREVHLLARVHVQVVQELEGLDHQGSALFVVSDVRVDLANGKTWTVKTSTLLFSCVFSPPRTFHHNSRLERQYFTRIPVLRDHIPHESLSRETIWFSDRFIQVSL